MEEDKSNFMGRTFEADEYFLVTAERIASFCASIGDDNPLYLDAAAAKAGPNGAIIAPPAFVARSANPRDRLPTPRAVLGGLRPTTRRVLERVAEDGQSRNSISGPRPGAGSPRERGQRPVRRGSGSRVGRSRRCLRGFF